MNRSNSKFSTLVFGSVALIIAVACWVQPINSAFYRVAFLTGVAGVFLALLSLIRRSLFKLLFVLVIGGLVFTIRNSEAPSVDRQTFEQLWVQSALSYVGTPYRFGGESFLGMDSGGLLRRSLVMTQLRLIAHELNPYFLKRAYTIWSSPFSLASLLHPSVTWVEFVGYYAPDRVVPLRPGDVLISRNRSEMVIYLGDDKVLGISRRNEKVGVHPLGDNALTLFSSWCYVVRWHPNHLGEKLDQRSKTASKSP